MGIRSTLGSVRWLAVSSALAACGAFGSEEAPGTADAGSTDGSGGDGGLVLDAAAPDGGAIDASSCTPAAGELVFFEGGAQVVDLSLATATTGPGYDVGHGSKACPIGVREPTPRWAAVVLNATGGTARLEAWGGCTSPAHEINVVDYVRATPPVTSAELASCAQASTGFYGTGSPSSGGSGWCKGLLADAGQAIELEACARAVVVFEFGSDASAYSPPPTGVVRLTP